MRAETRSSDHSACSAVLWATSLAMKHAECGGTSYVVLQRPAPTIRNDMAGRVSIGAWSPGMMNGSRRRSRRGDASVTKQVVTLQPGSHQLDTKIASADPTTGNAALAPVMPSEITGLLPIYGARTTTSRPPIPAHMQKAVLRIRQRATVNISWLILPCF